MKIRLLGVRIEVCWDEEPDVASEAVTEPVWVKTPGTDLRTKEYEGIVTSATRTGLYL